MTCKDCIHEKVCDALIKSGCPYLDEEVPADVFCMEFRNTALGATSAEVAREIFEEMDEILLPLLHEVSQVYIYIQLKRKYTEAGDDQSNT